MKPRCSKVIIVEGKYDKIRIAVVGGGCAGMAAAFFAARAGADVTIFDPNEEWVVDKEKFASKGRNTPFHGFTVKGKVKYTVANGIIIYQED